MFYKITDVESFKEWVWGKIKGDSLLSYEDATYILSLLNKLEVASKLKENKMKENNESAEPCRDSKETILVDFEPLFKSDFIFSKELKDFHFSDELLRECPIETFGDILNNIEAMREIFGWFCDFQQVDTNFSVTKGCDCPMTRICEDWYFDSDDEIMLLKFIYKMVMTERIIPQNP